MKEKRKEMIPPKGTESSSLQLATILIVEGVVLIINLRNPPKENINKTK